MSTFTQRPKELVYDSVQDAGAVYQPLFPLTRIEAYEVPRTHSKEALAEFAAKIEEVLTSPSVAVAYAAGGHVVVGYHPKGWMKVFEDLGVQVQNRGKVVKRIKSLTRVAAVRAVFEVSDFKIRIDDEPNDKLRSGLVIMKLSRLYEALEQSGIKEGHPKWKRFSKCRLWNLRAFTNLDGKPIMIKGNVLFAEEISPEADLFTHPDNIKFEVGGYLDGKLALLLEPMEPKDKVRTCLQTRLTLPLFKDTRKWLEDEVQRLKDGVMRGEVSEDLDELADSVEMLWAGQADAGHYTSYAYSLRYNAAQLHAALRDKGYPDPFVCAPHLRGEYFKMAAYALRDREKMDVHVKVPKSSYVQIICESMAALADYYVPGELKRGEIRRPKGWPFAVVHDQDWLERCYVNHDTPDFDDKFCLHYRKVGGQKMVFTLRFPCERGQWDVFQFVEGDHEPRGEWLEVDPKILSWPRAHLAKPEVTHSESPRDKRRAAYDQQQVLEDMQRAVSGGNPGGYINALMCYAASRRDGGLVEKKPFSASTYVDVCTQGGAHQDMVIGKEWAQKLVQEVAKSQRPVDTLVWQTRGKAAPRWAKPNLVETDITKTWQRAVELIGLPREYDKPELEGTAFQEVRAYAQDHKDVSFLAGFGTQQAEAAARRIMGMARQRVAWSEIIEVIQEEMTTHGTLHVAACLVRGGKEHFLYNLGVFEMYVQALRDQLPYRLEFNEVAGTLNGKVILDVDYHKETDTLLVAFGDNEVLKYKEVKKEPMVRKVVLRKMYELHNAAMKEKAQAQA